MVTVTQTFSPVVITINTPEELAKFKQLAYDAYMRASEGSEAERFANDIKNQLQAINQP